MELIMLHLWSAFPADFSISWATELLPCCLPSEIQIPETDCGLVCSVQLIDVHVCERSFAHYYILWGFEPSKSFGLCQFPLLQRKADRKSLRRWRRFLQGDRTLFLFHNVILWWALDFLSGIHETPFGIQSHFRMIYCIKTIGTSRGIYSGYHFFLVPCVLLSLMFLC